MIEGAKYQGGEVSIGLRDRQKCLLHYNVFDEIAMINQQTENWTKHTVLVALIKPVDVAARCNSGDSTPFCRKASLESLIYPSSPER
jgi:hypothetical protein